MFGKTEIERKQKRERIQGTEETSLDYWIQSDRERDRDRQRLEKKKGTSRFGMTLDVLSGTGSL